MLAQGEWKKIVGLVSICAVASIQAQRRQRILDERDAIENKLPLRERSIFEHPFVSYLVENGMILSSTLLSLRVPLIQGDPKANQISNAFRFLLRAFIFAESTLAIQEYFLLRVMYHNIPWFSELKRPKPTTFETVCDWLQSNFPNALLGTAFQVVMFGSQPDVWKQFSNPSLSQPIFVIPFLLRLGFTRIVVDIVFHVVHRWMHGRSVYKILHSRHHEHNKCGIVTNFHFTWMDAFLEAVLPEAVAFALLGAFGMGGGPIETMIIGNYITFFEGASHSGKEIPYATVFPPLSPLINAFTDIDRDNIKYHESHHNLVRCNYGITQWVDKLAGTHRLQKQPCELGVKEIQINEIPEDEGEM